MNLQSVFSWNKVFSKLKSLLELRLIRCEDIYRRLSPTSWCGRVDRRDSRFWLIYLLCNNKNEFERKWQLCFIAGKTLIIYRAKGYIPKGCVPWGEIVEPLRLVTMFCNTPPWSIQVHLIICRLPSNILSPQKPYGNIRSTQCILDSE
jgi:hypothetical protein